MTMSSQRLSKPPKANVFRMRSEGVSMYPLLHPGDLIEFQKISPLQVKMNDIVLLYLNEKFITHRVIYLTKNTIVTRGDNNPKEDDRVTLEHIIAKVVRFKRKGIWYNMGDIYINQSLVYISEIAQIAHQLQKANIKHVYIKGLVASLKYLHHFPQRIYSDIDLLIHRSDIFSVQTLFKKAKYRRLDDYWLSLFSPPKLDHRYEVDYVKKIRGIPVVFDVHLEPVFLMIKMKGMDLLYRDSLRAKLGAHFIQNATSLTVMGTKVPVCSSSDQVLYLLLHIFHNNFTDSIRLHLVDQVVRKTMKSLYWKHFQKITLQFKLEGYVYPSLILLRRYYKTPIPSSIITSLQPKGVIKQFVSNYVIRNTNIFRSPTRISGGILRFALSILLSPEPLYRKLLILIHPKTLFSVGWLAVKKLQTVILRSKIERSA